MGALDHERASSPAPARSKAPSTELLAARQDRARREDPAPLDLLARLAIESEVVSLSATGWTGGTARPAREPQYETSLALTDQARDAARD